MKYQDLIPFYQKLNYKCEFNGTDYKCGLDQVKDAVKDLHQKRASGHAEARETLQTMFGGDKRFEVVGRLKTPQSIQEKMQRRGVTDPSKFDDISGLRVVTTDSKSTQEAIQKIKKEFAGKIVPGTEDNYIENPKETGYHAYHVTVKVGGEPHEIQVRTKRFNEWAETYHSVYKGEEWAKPADTPATKKYFKDVALTYQAMDEGKTMGVMPPCPSELKKIGLCLG